MLASPRGGVAKSGSSHERASGRPGIRASRAGRFGLAAFARSTPREGRIKCEYVMAHPAAQNGRAVSEHSIPESPVRNYRAPSRASGGERRHSAERDWAPMWWRLPGARKGAGAEGEGSAAMGKHTRQKGPSGAGACCWSTLGATFVGHVDIRSCVWTKRRLNKFAPTFLLGCPIPL